MWILSHKVFISNNTLLARSRMQDIHAFNTMLRFYCTKNPFDWLEQRKNCLFCIENININKYSFFAPFTTTIRAASKILLKYSNIIVRKSGAKQLHNNNQQHTFNMLSGKSNKEPALCKWILLTWKA